MLQKLRDRCFVVWCSNSRFHGQDPQESVRRLPLGFIFGRAPVHWCEVLAYDCCPHLCRTIRLTMGNGLPQPLISHSARGHPLTHTHTRSYGPLTPSRLSRTRRSGDAMQRQVCSPDQLQVCSSWMARAADWLEHYLLAVLQLLTFLYSCLFGLRGQIRPRLFRTII